jgi:hypothetical protein
MNLDNWDNMNCESKIHVFFQVILWFIYFWKIVLNNNENHLESEISETTEKWCHPILEGDDGYVNENKSTRIYSR